MQLVDDHDFNDVTVTVIFVDRFRFKEYRHKSWNEYVQNKYEMSEMKSAREVFLDRARF